MAFAELDDDELSFYRGSGIAALASGPVGAALDPHSNEAPVHPDFGSPKLPLAFQRGAASVAEMPRPLGTNTSINVNSGLAGGLRGIGNSIGNNRSSSSFNSKMGSSDGAMSIAERMKRHFDPQRFGSSTRAPSASSTASSVSSSEDNDHEPVRGASQDSGNSNNDDGADDHTGFSPDERPAAPKSGGGGTWSSMFGSSSQGAAGAAVRVNYSVAPSPSPSPSISAKTPLQAQMQMPAGLKLRGAPEQSQERDDDEDFEKLVTSYAPMAARLNTNAATSTAAAPFASSSFATKPLPQVYASPLSALGLKQTPTSASASATAPGNSSFSRSPAGMVSSPQDDAENAPPSSMSMPMQHHAPPPSATTPQSVAKRFPVRGGSNKPIVHGSSVPAAPPPLSAASRPIFTSSSVTAAAAATAPVSVAAQPASLPSLLGSMSFSSSSDMNGKRGGAAAAAAFAEVDADKANDDDDDDDFGADVPVTVPTRRVVPINDGDVRALPPGRPSGPLSPSTKNGSRGGNDSAPLSPRAKVVSFVEHDDGRMTTGATIGTNVGRPLTALLSSTGSTSALRTQLLNTDPASPAAAGTAAAGNKKPALPVTVNRTIEDFSGSSYVPSFGEYDGDDDLPGENASPPRVPPGMTPTALAAASASSSNRNSSARRDNNSGSGGADASSSNHSVSQFLAFSHSPSQDASSSISGTMLPRSKYDSQQPQPRSSSEESAVGMSFDSFSPQSVAANILTAKRSEAPMPHRGGAGAAASSSKPKSLLMNAKTMFGGRSGSASRSTSTSPEKPAAAAAASVAAAAPKPKASAAPSFATEDDDDDLFRFDEKDLRGDAGGDDSPPGFAFGSMSRERSQQQQQQQQPKQAAAPRKSADEILSSPGVKSTVRGAAAAAALGPAGVDILRFGYAAKATAAAEQPSSEEENDEDETSPLRRKATNNKTSNAATPSAKPKTQQTALQLLQSNMALSSEGANEMRAFVGSLKDARGKPVRPAASSSSPERQNAAAPSASAAAGPVSPSRVGLTKNAFLRDLPELPPSSTAATDAVLGRTPVKATARFEHSPGNSKDSPVNRLRAYEASKKDYTTGLTAIPNVDIVPGGLVLDASPSTRQAQRWQIDRSPQVVPSTMEIAAGNSASPVAMGPLRAAAAAAARAAGHAAFPVPPAQSMQHHQSPQKQKSRADSDADNDEQHGPFTPPHFSASNAFNRGGHAAHSRLAQQVVAELGSRRILDCDAVVPTAIATRAGVEDDDEDEDIVIKTNANGEVEVVAVPATHNDVSVVVAMQQDGGDDDRFSPDRSVWTTRRVLIAIGVAVGVIIVVILAVVGFVML